MRIFTQLTTLASVAALATLPAMARPMEIEDVPKIQSAGGLTVSADGDVIAYGVSVQRNLLEGDKDGSADTHVYIVRDGGAPTLFVGGEGSKSSLSFSADGSALHFRAKRDGDESTALYAISLSGGEAKKVFEHTTSLGDYAVSADGETLYFVATEKDDDKEALKKKGFKAYAYEEDLDMASVWKVSLTEADAKAEKLFEGVDVHSLELAPDGSFLVIAASPTALVDDYYMKSRLHVIDANTGEKRVTVETPGKLGQYKISPDGRSIAFQGGTDIHDTSDGVLMIAAVADGSFRQLTADALQHIQDLEWLDNGQILTTAHRGVKSLLVVYDTQGNELRTLPTTGNIVVRNAEVSTDGDIYFTADSPEHPSEVFLQSDRTSRKLSDHNTWLDEITLAPQNVFTYNARDGREIEGLLITPQGDIPADGWPLILTVHGGPEAHYSDGWLTAYSMAGQFAAGDGYAVFYPNYRGSTGRGVAFAKEHQDDYAGKEFNDLVDGVNALADAGYVDKDRAGITGGSYGGYASMWGATALTDTFAASVAFVGISNQVSKFGTSDIPNEMYLVHSLKWPWDDNDGHWMELLKRSPLFYAGQATTPTLIMHGAEDTRVHPSQSMELYRAMKVRTETPVRLVFYPGEGHGNSKAASRLDYSYRLMRWMDTYLAEGASRNDEMPAFDLNMEEKLGSAEDDAEK